MTVAPGVIGALRPIVVYYTCMDSGQPSAGHVGEHGGWDPAVSVRKAVAFYRSWKGWDVNDYSTGGIAKCVDLAFTRLIGGMSLGTIHEQRFYAIRANGQEIRFPFSAQPFTAMVDISRPVDEQILTGYAQALIDHGCVQAVCRGEESSQLVDIFNQLAEKGELDKHGTPFTSMCMEDEPLNEAIEYFVLPSGLAQTGLLMIIGDSGDFQSAIDGFSSAAGAISEGLAEPLYSEEDVVCFGAS